MYNDEHIFVDAGPQIIMNVEAKNVAKMCLSDKDCYVGVTVPPTIRAYCNMKTGLCVYVPRPSGNA